MSAPPLDSSFFYRMATSLSKAWADWFTSVGSSITGLGTMSTQNANSVTITGGSISGISDLAVADGGTGASTATAARFNLGVSGYKYISGITWANNVSDANNDIDISAGECIDSTNSIILVGSGMTKRLDAAWSEGTNQGGLFSGTKANSTEYYIHKIGKADGSVDYGFDTSITATNKPVAYPYYRCVGWCKTNSSGNIVGAIVTEEAGGGVKHIWKVPVSDINLYNTLGTSARLDAMSVPTGIKVEILGTVRATDIISPHRELITDPDTTYTAPTTELFTLSTYHNMDGTASVSGLMTNTSRQIRSRSNIDTVDLYSFCTTGFKWSRR